MKIMAYAMSRTPLEAVPTPPKESMPARWRGDIGLCSVVQQSVDTSLAYLIRFLAGDPAFVPSLYKSWLPDAEIAFGQKEPRELGQSLVWGAAKAWADCGLEGFRRWADTVKS
jgi:hypothetical protein